MFSIVDMYGIFVPQIGLTVGCLAICVYMKDAICQLDDIPVDDWRVSEAIIRQNQENNDSENNK